MYLLCFNFCNFKKYFTFLSYKSFLKIPSLQLFFQVTSFLNITSALGYIYLSIQDRY